MDRIRECPRRATKERGGVALPLVVGVAAVIVTIGVLLLLDNIRTRQAEGRETIFRVVALDETSYDPAEWGKNFPRQYDSYRRTVDVVRTRHGGSEAFQKLDEFPVWRKIFAGYAFSIDYREERGHAYMLVDQRETDRVKLGKQPGACLHCHASNVGAYRTAGLERGAPGALTDPLLSATGLAQLHTGFAALNALPYEEVTERVEHPVSCIDCHDPDTLQLRVTRPAFMTAIQVLAASDDPLPHLPSVERWRAGDRKEPYDVHTAPSRQEMRTLVCAQCHVEYYFAGEEKLLTYPWHRGLKVERIEAYYDAQGFADWTHAISGAPVLKAQHPEFETWSQGIHARSGVSCADCHMPYVREGAIKVSDHHVRSPLLNVARSCQTCHRFPEAELLARAEAIQDRTRALEDRAEIAVADLIDAIAAAMAAGAGDDALREPRRLQRAAQFRLDFVSAENSRGFHADSEAARILAEAIDLARQGELAVERRRAD